MAFEISKVDIWTGELADRPRALMRRLAVLSQAGANLEFVIVRRDRRGRAVAFMAPLKGAAQARAAKKAGLAQNAALAYLRVTAPNKAGLGAKIAGALGDAGLNMVGLSAAAIGRQSVCYVEVKKQDAAKARAALKKALGA